MKITSETYNTKQHYPVLLSIPKREMKTYKWKIEENTEKRQKKDLRILILSLFKCFEITVNVSTLML